MLHSIQLSSDSLLHHIFLPPFFPSCDYWSWPSLTLLSVGWYGVCAVAPGQSVCPWPSSPFSSTSSWCLFLFPFTTSHVTPSSHPRHTSYETWHAPTTPLWGRVAQLSCQLIPHTEILPMKMPIRRPKVMCEHFLTCSYQWKRVKMPQWTHQSVWVVMVPTELNLWSLGCQSWKRCLTILFTICPDLLSLRRTGCWKQNQRWRPVRRAPRCGQYFKAKKGERFLLSHNLTIKAYLPKTAFANQTHLYYT